MDHLLKENRNGIISLADLQVLQGLVEEAEKLLMENAKNLAATADPSLRLSERLPSLFGSSLLLLQNKHDCSMLACFKSRSAC